MANTKSAKKQARKNITRRQKNLIRKTSLKTAVKKVLVALESKEDSTTLQSLLRDAESKLARAKGKNTLHPKSASRKVSRLAKKINDANKK